MTTKAQGKVAMIAVIHVPKRNTHLAKVLRPGRINSFKVSPRKGRKFNLDEALTAAVGKLREDETHEVVTDVQLRREGIRRKQVNDQAWATYRGHDEDSEPPNFYPPYRH